MTFHNSTSILRAKKQTRKNSIKCSTLLAATFFLIITTSLITSYSEIWNFARSTSSSSSSPSAGGVGNILKSSFTTTSNTNNRFQYATNQKTMLLDGVLDIRDVIQLNKDCPPNRKLWANSSEPFDTFIHRVFVTANKSVHEPFQRPIEEIADKFDYLVENNQFITHGFWAEFGVFLGKTLEYASDRIIGFKQDDEPVTTKEQKDPPQQEIDRATMLFKGVMAGFDSFQGLPVSWRKGFPKGDFGGRGKIDLYSMVRSKLPQQVELYKGWFQDTIGIFKSKYPNMPAAVIHHDGDLFLSTAITLQLLADRIVPGTHMIFDEIFGYPGYENHEILALYLWMVDHEAELCAMGHKSYINETDYRSRQREQDPFEQSVWYQVLSVK